MKPLCMFLWTSNKYQAAKPPHITPRLWGFGRELPFGLSLRVEDSRTAIIARKALAVKVLEKLQRTVKFDSVGGIPARRELVQPCSEAVGATQLGKSRLIGMPPTLSTLTVPQRETYGTQGGNRLV